MCAQTCSTSTGVMPPPDSYRCRQAMFSAWHNTATLATKLHTIIYRALHSPVHINPGVIPACLQTILSCILHKCVSLDCSLVQNTVHESTLRSSWPCTIGQTAYILFTFTPATMASIMLRPRACKSWPQEPTAVPLAGCTAGTVVHNISCKHSAWQLPSATWSSSAATAD